MLVLRHNSLAAEDLFVVERVSEDPTYCNVIWSTAELYCPVARNYFILSMHMINAHSVSILMCSLALGQSSME